MTETNSLLREYARAGSETAFRQLVTQYIDLVYSTAVRRMSGDTHAAEDVVQTVFTDLARKSESLPENVMLGGWLHKHTCFVASNFRRTETRRLAREKEAAAMEHGSEANWSEIEPALDEAIEQLDHEDRDAIVLRFFERRDFRAIGETIGSTENAAQKRVTRALEKLRALLAQRGVALSASGLLVALTNQSIIAAPNSLATKTTEFALANAKSGISIWVTSLGIAALISIAAILFVKAPQTKSSVTVSPAAASIPVPNATVPVQNIPTQNAAPSASIASGNLRLSILAAGSDHPIPNVPIEYFAWTEDGLEQNTLYTSRLGICNVPVPTNTTELRLTTRLDGFADTRLLWETSKGAVIPSEYTLGLEPGVLIAGKVINNGGQLVPNSTVRIGRYRDSDYGFKIESHDFDSFEVIAEDGTWQVSRVAKAALTQLGLRASHPDYMSSDSIPVNSNTDIIDQFRSGDFSLVLKDGARVRGIVLNESALPIADAEIQVGMLGIVGSRSGKSQPDGSFDIGGVQPGKMRITVSAPGYAAGTLDIESPSNDVYEILLKPGRALKARIVNQRGEPITNASVRLETLPEPVTNALMPPQLDVRLRPDEDGRIFWKDAPAEKVKFLIDARGYMRLASVWIAADGVEHIITMLPNLTVFGSVRDSKSGKPIPRFRVIAGWPENTAMFNGTIDPIVWEYGFSATREFANGQFKRVIQTSVIQNQKQDRYIFKVEADGYLPAITRVVEHIEGSVDFNLALQPAP